MDKLLETYWHYAQEAEPGSAAHTAYSMIVDQLEHALSILEAKNAIHTFELMASSSETALIFQAARYRLEHLLR